MKKYTMDHFRLILDRAEANTESPEQFAESVNDTLKSILTELGIAKLTVFMDNEASRETVFYSEVVTQPTAESESIRGISRTYRFGINTECIISAWPVAEVIWTNSEQKEISAFIETLRLYYEKAVLARLFSKAYYYDSLTGFYNSEGMYKLIEEEEKAGRLSMYRILFVNIIRMKFYNTRYGRKEGDRLLKEYSSMVANCLGDHGVIGRMGGDNFLILVRENRFSWLSQLLRGVNVTVNTPEGDRTLTIKSRIGIYKVEENVSTHMAIDHASTAFAFSRQPDSPEWCEYTPKLQQNAMYANGILTSFQKALEKGEIAPYYQPKVNADTLEICGAEALVRWCRSGVILLPDKYVPILERGHVIGILDLFVLEQVCKDIRSWMDRGIEPVRISVNFSKDNLNNPDFVKQLLAVVDKYEIDTKYLEIELTESTFYKDQETLAEVIKQVRERGISVAVDDFGIGFSAISMLTSVDVDVIKMDQSFLAHVVDEQGRDAVLYRSLVDMIHALNLEIVTEGVETLEQLRFVRKAGCKILQGFLFDHAMPEAKFSDLLEQKKAYTEPA